LKSKRDAAAYLDISLRTLDKYIAAGKIKVVRFGGRKSTVKLHQADLEAFIEARRG